MGESRPQEPTVDPGVRGTLLSPVAAWRTGADGRGRCSPQALEKKGISHLEEKELKERNKRIQEDNRLELQKVGTGGLQSGPGGQACWALPALTALFLCCPR